MITLKSLRGILIISMFFMTAGLTSCHEETNPVSEEDIYKGPVAEGVNIESLLSDSARVKIKLKAARQLQFENGDQEFPEGLYIEFYNEKEELSTTLKANTAKYEKSTDIYTGTGDVVVNNLLEEKQLNSEKLHWARRKREVYTDAFVRIQTPEQTIMGEGLTTDENFSNYRIHKTSGTFTVND